LQDTADLTTVWSLTPFLILWLVVAARRYTYYWDRREQEQFAYLEDPHHQQY
jgi:hypothetical protein